MILQDCIGLQRFHHARIAPPCQMNGAIRPEARFTEFFLTEKFSDQTCENPETIAAQAIKKMGEKV